MWIFNTFIQWFIGLILDVIGDIMSWFSVGLGGLFSTSKFFDEMFLGNGDVGIKSLIELFTTVGITLCIAFIFVGVVRSVVAGFGWTGENPIKMIGRLVIGVFLSFTLYGFLKDFLFGGENTIFYKIYELSKPTINILQNPEGAHDLASLQSIENLGVAAIGGIAMNLLLIFITIAILTNFIKMLLELFERYILVNVLFVFAPLAPAGLVLESTTKVFQSYLKFVFGQLTLLWFDNIFFGMSIGALEFAADAVQDCRAIDTILALFAVLAFLKIFQRLDNYMRDVGMLVGVTGGSLLTEVFAAAKSFESIKKHSSKSGGTGSVGGLVGSAASTAGAAVGKVSGVAKSVSAQSFSSGVGGVAATRVSSGIKSFISNYGEAREAGMSLKESAKMGGMYFKERMQGFGTDVLDATISPGARNDIKTAFSKIGSLRHKVSGYESNVNQQNDIGTSIKDRIDEYNKPTEVNVPLNTENKK